MTYADYIDAFIEDLFIRPIGIMVILLIYLILFIYELTLQRKVVGEIEKEPKKWQRKN